MKELKTFGFSNNKNEGLFIQTDCELIGEFGGKPLIPHTSERLSKTICKAVEEEINNRMICFDKIRKI